MKRRRAPHAWIGVVALVACSPSGGAPGVCTPSDKRCGANDGVETCGPDGQWGPETACVAQACVAGSCVGACAPGTQGCDGAVTRTCDGNGDWQPGPTCPIACCAGACVDPATDTANCGTCGNACDPNATCATSLTAFSGTRPPDWAANGSATYDDADQAAQLTDLSIATAGTWVFQRELFVDDVTIQFDFYAGGGTGADGIGLMFETTGPNAVGYSGGGLGMTGLGGFGVELDTFDDTSCSDDNSNHVAIDSIEPCTGTQPQTLVQNDQPGLTLGDGAWHTSVVSVAKGAFTVSVDGHAELTDYAPASFQSGKFWLGFAAATGGYTNYHRVRNVSVAFKTPHCL